MGFLNLHPKVQNGGIAGLITVVVVAAADYYGHSLSPTQTALLATAINSVAGYVTKPPTP